MRVRKTPLFSMDSQKGIYELKISPLTFENLDKQFGQDKTPTPSKNRNAGFAINQIKGNELNDEDEEEDDLASDNSSTSVNSAIRKYLNLDLPDEALKD